MKSMHISLILYAEHEFNASTFTGRVVQIRNSPITVQNVVTYDTVISVTNADFKLKPGMTATVDIAIVDKPDILMVPNSALRFDPVTAAAIVALALVAAGTGVAPVAPFIGLLGLAVLLAAPMQATAAALLAFAVFIVFRASRSLVQQVQRTASAVSRQDPQALGLLPLDGVVTEMRPAVEATNHLLARLAATVGMVGNATYIILIGCRNDAVPPAATTVPPPSCAPTSSA